MAYLISFISHILKSLFYQGNSNTENMQGTGFAWLVRPAIKKYSLKFTPEEEIHLNDYFNTNPSFITTVTSIFIREHILGRNAFTAKGIYSSAFAALGDSFFWHALRPLLFMVALFVCINITPWGVVIYPALYTSFHLLCLITGSIVGTIWGIQSIKIFNRLHFTKWAEFGDRASVFMLGLITVQLIKKGTTGDYRAAGILVGCFIAGAILSRFIKTGLMFWFIITVMVMILVLYGGNFI